MFTQEAARDVNFETIFSPTELTERTLPSYAGVMKYHAYLRKMMHTINGAEIVQSIVAKVESVWNQLLILIINSKTIYNKIQSFDRKYKYISLRITGNAKIRKLWKKTLQNLSKSQEHYLTLLFASALTH